MKKTKIDNRSFAAKHPKLNLLIGFLLIISLVLLCCAILYFVFKYLGIGISKIISWLSTFASKLDAVVIVALITGTVSLTGVIISSIISKIIEYKKQRQMYLAQKREKSYGAFVEMVYKIQQNNKKNGSYTEQEMIRDMISFSQELTLWGSKKVADKWVKFRLNGDNPEYAQKNIFVLEDIMNEMRKDMGVKRTKKGKLLSFFVNDIENALRAKR